MPLVKYHNALGSDGNVIDISSVTAQDRDKEFRCLGCGELMRPRLGRKNAHHFAHKSDVFNCSPETYLHKLAKQKIKDWFDSCRPFKISFYQYTVCSDAGTCPFYKDEMCRDRRLKTYDLRKHYDTCSIEQPIDSFIADLLLTSKKNPPNPPILIEIQVTHKSETEKLESGHKIIEVKITSEDDIESLVQSPEIKETGDSSYGYNPKPHLSISFYGFKEGTTPEKLGMRTISKFYLHKSGKAHFNYSPCRESRISNSRIAILELAIDTADLSNVSIYEVGYAIAKRKGIIKKHCRQCKYHREYESTSDIFCCLNNKYGTPRNPDGPEAMSCQYYSVDPQRKQEILAVADTVPFVVAKK